MGSSNVFDVERCPSCGIMIPTDEHLKREIRHALNNADDPIFGHLFRRMGKQVSVMLAARQPKVVKRGRPRKPALAEARIA